MGLYNPASESGVSEVFSSNPPTSPTEGTRWSELSPSGNIIERWTRYGNRWVSAIKTLPRIVGYRDYPTDYILPVDPFYKYVYTNLFEVFTATIDIVSPVTVVSMFIVDDEVLSYYDFTGLAQYDNKVFHRELNREFDFTTSSKTQIILQHNAGYAAYSYSFELRYYLVRR